MKRKKKDRLPVKYILLIMSCLCILVIGLSVKMSLSSDIVDGAIGYVIIPMQKGVNKLGTLLSDIRDDFVDKQTLQAENKELTEQLETAKEELNQVQLNENELEHLRELYDMDQNYSEYDKVAASVIGKDSGNWFSTFVIDKGTNDGITENMNVIAQGGLCGIVIEAGPNYSKVRSIIDDTNNVSAMDSTTEDLCVVHGSLQSMTENNTIEFSDLNDSDNQVIPGDQICTSNISDYFLKGIPIGYVTEVNTDPNNLTKSGYIATIVDFEHLDTVFVILETKSDTYDDQGE